MEDHCALIRQVDNKKYQVRAVSKSDNEVVLEGLPDSLKQFLFNFTNQELLEDTLDVINVLITMYDSKGNGQVSMALPLPTEDEFKQILG